ncbi:hypothetical protein ACFFKU_03495 [Kineococcus gynurae]|uniref:Secreted protein n=1 Tax=Kineococcus gynurae TaxID=452979 RepID=A0ABV5LRW3_9ACTN
MLIRPYGPVALLLVSSTVGTSCTGAIACTDEGSPSGIQVDGSAYDVAAPAERGPRSLEVCAADRCSELDTAYWPVEDGMFPAPLSIEETPDPVTVTFRVHHTDSGLLVQESTVTVPTLPVVYPSFGRGCEREGR